MQLWHESLRGPRRSVGAEQGGRLQLGWACYYRTDDFFPSLSAVISNGDFLLALSPPEATHPTVCCITSTLHPDKLVVNWWVNNNKLAIMGVEQVSPPTEVNEYIFLKKCRPMEVSELSYSSSKIMVDLVKDLSFVFHANMLEEELLNCAGMSRVYYTRYSYHVHNRVTLITQWPHSPFLNYVLDSFPSCIWYSILDIKQVVEKQLNDPKQYNVKMLS